MLRGLVIDEDNGIEPVKNSIIVATRRREKANERQKYVSRATGTIKLGLG
jgi:hypothetical protein